MLKVTRTHRLSQSDQISPIGTKLHRQEGTNKAFT